MPQILATSVVLPNKLMTSPAGVCGGVGRLVMLSACSSRMAACCQFDNDMSRMLVPIGKRQVAAAGARQQVNESNGQPRHETP